jgi:hypothetical protein
MSRPRPRPVPEASPRADALADALETVAPLLEQLEALEAIRTILDAAIRMQAALPGLQREYGQLTAEVPRLKTQERELQANITHAMEQVVALERRGVLVKLS